MKVYEIWEGNYNVILDYNVEAEDERSAIDKYMLKGDQWLASRNYLEAREVGQLNRPSK